MMQALLLSVLLADSRVDVAFAFAQAQARTTPSVPVSPQPPATPATGKTYAEQYAEAIRTGKPLLVWVGQPRPTGNYGDVLACEAPTFPGIAGAGCVVATPDGRGGLLRLRDLTGTPTPADVNGVLSPPLARYFSSAAVDCRT